MSVAIDLTSQWELSWSLNIFCLLK